MIERDRTIDLQLFVVWAWGQVRLCLSALELPTLAALDTPGTDDTLEYEETMFVFGL